MDSDRSRGFRRTINKKNTVFGNLSLWELFVRSAAEIIGTGLLVGVGCMGTISGMGVEANQMHVSIAFGLIVAAIIQIFGHISEAHLNPAVSVCAVILSHINIPTALVYAISQCIGGILGYGVLESLLPEYIFEKNKNDSVYGMCVTVPHPDLTNVQAFFGEFVATTVLILLICGIWDKRNAANQDSAALKFGFVIAAISMTEGQFTGASMNPARSLGPAFWNDSWKQHWVYWLGPLMSALIVTSFYKFFFGVKENQEICTNESREMENLFKNPVTQQSSNHKDVNAIEIETQDKV